MTPLHTASSTSQKCAKNDLISAQAISSQTNCCLCAVCEVVKCFCHREIKECHASWQMVCDEDLSCALWHQMLGGPRPLSVQWPLRRNQATVNQRQPQPDRLNGSSHQPRRWRGGERTQHPKRETKTPDDDAAEVQGRIETLEKAIKVLGEFSLCDEEGARSISFAVGDRSPIGLVGHTWR